MARRAVQKRSNVDATDTAADFGIAGVRVLTPAEGRALLDRQTRRVLGMSAEEFLARWDAHEIDTTNPETHGAIMGLVGLIPFAR